jgi:hypothetical protein
MAVHRQHIPGTSVRRSHANAFEGLTNTNFMMETILSREAPMLVARGGGGEVQEGFLAPMLR